MSDCAVVRDLLPIYFDNETSPETSGFIREHLKTCASCRELYRSMDRLPRTGAAEAVGISGYTATAKRIGRSIFAGAASIAAFMLLAGCAAGYLIRNSIGKV